MAFPEGKSFDEFGGAVCISESYAAIGAPYAETGANKGKAFILYRNPASGLWGVKQTLSNPEPLNNQFGKSVCISGDYVIIGAPWELINGHYQGSEAFNSNQGKVILGKVE
jgi:hypothetical protein